MIHKNFKWLRVASIGFLVFIVFGAYFKIFSAEFVYDDYAFIVNNKAIHGLSPVSKFFTDPNIFTGAQDNLGGKNWRPISSLAFALQYKVFGANPAGFHFIGILFHLINALLVYFLAKKLLNRTDGALAIASLWALHPVLTEAVSWISNQSSLIFFGFFLTAILALFKERFWASYLFFAFSLLSKETALGGLVVIAAIFFINKINWKKFIPFVLIGLAYFWLRFEILESLGDHVLRGSFWQNLLLAPAVFWKYIALSVWPANLLLDYSNFPLPSGIFDIRVILGVLSLISCGLLIWLSIKKSWPYFGLGIVWFIAFLLPVMQIIPFQDIVGERFLYAPLAGFFLAAVWGFEKLPEHFVGAGTKILIVILFIFFGLTMRRNNDWMNSENLWQSVLRVDSRNEKAAQNLSAFYLQKGDGEKIVEFSKKLLEINPNSKAGRLHLAVGKIMKGEYKEAEAELLMLIKKYPDFQEARNNLLVLYQQTGQDGFILGTATAPAVEGNIVNSGIAGKVVIGSDKPFEASLAVYKSDNPNTPFISVRAHSDGTFQIPLRQGFYILKPLDPDGPAAPVKESYSFIIGNGQWLQVKIEYK
ncbi:MAG: TPR domain protein [Candidatus Gottesmanbacteria bacterium GW2011_GWA2_47_9]|uniref:TPR domain protein n=1 Tax=Candidatus Gottesmanbacteria bacterium GW2011_GWA2_47_9 TaxID=1618445 RepID=A0A0G1WVB4_9BACT|nr:MAG: TPR domain protein [Candidatus Gottesmanbacteria bacterium GW2011_GWA2_47_9]